MTFSFLNPSPLSTYETEASATRRLETARRAATDELTVAMRAVRDLELKLNIEQTWTEADPEYQDAKKYLRHRDFHRALDHVQQLVVQRLFEMSKANIVGMGNVAPVHSVLILHYSNRLQNADVNLEGIEAAWQGNSYCHRQVQQARNRDESASTNLRLEKHRELHVCI